MTKPSAKVSVSQGLIDRFADYHRRNLAWGVFHVWLDDGNYDSSFSVEQLESWGMTLTDEERELGAIFEDLSATQRAKISKRA